MVFARLFRRKASASEAVVLATYEAIVAAARQPVIYSHWNVPDTPLGRFESLSLHMILFLHRTKDAGQAVQSLGQAVVEEFFQDVDHSLRELGIGDTSVPKRMKKLARMFYGRAAAYDEYLNSGDAAGFAHALSRNIAPDTPEWPQAAALATHALEIALALRAQSDDDLKAGRASIAAGTQ